MIFSTIQLASLNPSQVRYGHNFQLGLSSLSFGKLKSLYLKMSILLRLTHWQLFLVTIGVPLIINIILTISRMGSQNSPFILTTSLITSIISVTIILAWFYALGTNLHQKLPDTAKMNLKRFKIILSLTAFYSVLFVVFNKTSGHRIMNMDTAIYFMPVHLFFMLCIFYCWHFNAKALKAVELHRNVAFDDFASEFFLLLFYPVGIWIIQPRINKLFDK